MFVSCIYIAHIGDIKAALLLGVIFYPEYYYPESECLLIQGH